MNGPTFQKKTPHQKLFMLLNPMILEGATHFIIQHDEPCLCEIQQQPSLKPVLWNEYTVSVYEDAVRIPTA
jgi:hypothetical protein